MVVIDIYICVHNTYIYNLIYDIYLTYKTNIHLFTYLSAVEIQLSGEDPLLLNKRFRKRKLHLAWFPSKVNCLGEISLIIRVVVTEVHYNGQCTCPPDIKFMTHNILIHFFVLDDVFLDFMCMKHFCIFIGMYMIGLSLH